MSLHTVLRCCHCQMEVAQRNLVCGFCDHGIIDCAKCCATSRRVEPVEFRMIPKPTKTTIASVRRRLAEYRVTKIHQDGATKYREDWAPANIVACDTIVAAGLHPNEHRLLGALIAARLCVWKNSWRAWSIGFD